MGRRHRPVLVPVCMATSARCPDPRRGAQVGLSESVYGAQKVMRAGGGFLKRHRRRYGVQREEAGFVWGFFFLSLARLALSAVSEAFQKQGSRRTRRGHWPMQADIKCGDARKKGKKGVAATLGRPG